MIKIAKKREPLQKVRQNQTTYSFNRENNLLASEWMCPNLDILPRLPFAVR